MNQADGLRGVGRAGGAMMYERPPRAAVKTKLRLLLSLLPSSALIDVREADIGQVRGSRRRGPRVLLCFQLADWPLRFTVSDSRSLDRC